MTYRIDTNPDGVRAGILRHQWDVTVVLVGCGGTGGFLAEAICRLLLGRNARLFLVDPDRVEPHNVARQAFDRADIGRFKAHVLAERLARRFGGEVAYSVLPYDRELHARVFGRGSSRLDLIAGCVDNAAARRNIATTLEAAGAAAPRLWWLDCGNARNSGQVLLGNALRPDVLRRAFDPQLGVCRALPAPSLQRPDLLETPALPPLPAPALDCAEAVAQGDQGATINQMVAAVAASFVEHLLAGTCRWMGAYFDLDDGLVHFVPADPKLVADGAGLPVRAVAPPVAAGRRA